MQENKNVVLKCGCEEERFARPSLCRGKAGDAPAGRACEALRCHRPGGCVCGGVLYFFLFP